LDNVKNMNPPPATKRTQAFTLWLRSSNFHPHRGRASTLVQQLLADNPFTTLQIVLEPTNGPQALTTATFDALLYSAFHHPTYLARFYSVSPGRIKGAKRLVVVLPSNARDQVEPDWLEEISHYATTAHMSPNSPLPSP